MTYLILEADSIEKLQTQVQEHIDAGWEPLGGVAVATYGAGAWWYYQAVVQYATEESAG